MRTLCFAQVGSQTRRAPLLTSSVGYPMERVAMDIMEPLPVTDRKNRYILVVGDYYTKWVETFLLSNQESCTVERVFFDEFVCRFGTLIISTQIRGEILSQH